MTQRSTLTETVNYETGDWNDPWNKNSRPETWEEVEAWQAYLKSMEPQWKGVETPMPVQIWDQADHDTLRNLATSMANTNPLYFDHAYAAKTPFGRVVAPPYFLVLVAEPDLGEMGRESLAQSGAMSLRVSGGVDYEFYTPVLFGDPIHYTATREGTELKRGRQMGPAYMNTGTLKFYNQHNLLVGKVKCWSFHAAGDALKRGRPFRQYQEYTDDQLKALEAIEMNEANTIRGATPRYYEDVKVGEELPPFARGPLRVGDGFGWMCAGGTSQASTIAYIHKVGSVETKDLPKYHGKPLPPPQWTSVPALMRKNMGAAARLDASAIGTIRALPSDSGGWGVPTEHFTQRAAVGMTPLTHWMGDRGFLKRMRLEFRHVHQVGDTVYLKGKVTSKEVKDGEHLVHFNYWSENQLGEVTSPGAATVALPSKAAR